jgi:hypothetical protein
MIQPSYLSSELARLRADDLINQAANQRLVREARARRAASRPTIRSRVRQLLAARRPPIVIPAQRAGRAESAPHPLTRPPFVPADKAPR